MRRGGGGGGRNGTGGEEVKRVKKAAYKPFLYLIMLDDERNNEMSRSEQRKQISIYNVVHFYPRLKNYYLIFGTVKSLKQTPHII